MEINDNTPIVTIMASGGNATKLQETKKIFFQNATGKAVQLQVRSDLIMDSCTITADGRGFFVEFETVEIAELFFSALWAHLNRPILWLGKRKAEYPLPVEKKMYLIFP